jgi:sporulation protein YlmC with PRC-barrel domain
MRHMGCRRVVGITALAMLTSVDAWAQMPREPQEPARVEVPAAGDALRSSFLIGARVRNAEGNDLGEIDELLIDPTTGHISHLVLGIGGLAGVGETKRVVAWNDVRLTVDPVHARRMIANVDQAVIERAPRWKRPEDRRVQQRGSSASPSTAPPVQQAPDTAPPSRPQPR